MGRDGRLTPKRGWAKTGVFLLLAALCSCKANRGLIQIDGAIPVARVTRGDVELTAHVTGELRATKTAMLVAPPVGGGTLQIINLLKTGTRVKAGDLVVEFDPSEQEYNLEQRRSDLMQAEQEIAKAKADTEVQVAQDKVALLKASFAVRQAELDVSRNEIVSAIDGKKNLLKLEEAKRALAQLQQDIASHAASNKATMAVAEEKRNHARLEMEQARHNIDVMKLRAPIDGFVEDKENRDATGGMFFTGMTLPEYREGDQVHPGSFIAQVFDTGQMELQSRVSETSRANLKLGESIEVRVDALPRQEFKGSVKTVAGMASNDMWGGDRESKFDATFQLAKPDPRLRAGLTAEVTVFSGTEKNALYLPRQAIFEKNGKPIVYVKQGGSFEAREVKIKNRTENRVTVENLSEGTEVALVNPEKAGEKKAEKTGGPITPGGSGGL